MAYNTDGCIRSGEDAFTHEITASETVTDCFNFGEEMAGTSCVEQEAASANSRPCVRRGLIPKSIDAEGNCAFYSQAHCQGDALYTHANSLDCVTGQEFLSYKCVSTTASKILLVGIRANIEFIVGVGTL
jgi:hypothetical protein